MLKKSLIMLVLLAMAVAANAATSSVWFEVDAQDVASGYLPSDIITINLVADFDVFAAALSIGADGGTAEGLGTLHANLATGQAPYTEGTLYNDAGILIIGVSGGAPRPPRASAGRRDCIALPSEDNILVVAREEVLCGTARIDV